MYSIAEYAALKGITRQGVLKQIDSGKIKAQKVGRSYVVLEPDEIIGKPGADNPPRPE